MHRLSHDLSLHLDLPCHIRLASSIDAALTSCPLEVLSIYHHTATSTWVKLTKVESVIALSVHTSMLDLCSNLVVYHRLLVLANNINTQLEYVLLSQFSWLRLLVLLTQSHAIDECSVAALDVFDEDAALSVGIDFGVLSGQHFRVEVAIEGGRNGLLVGLSANTQHIGVVGHSDSLSVEGSVDREQVENCRRLGLLLIA